MLLKLKILSCLISLCFTSSKDIIQTKNGQQRTGDGALNTRKQGQFIREKGPEKPTGASSNDVIEEKIKDAKGDMGEQPRNIKKEYGKNNDDTKDIINDDLQHLSAASTHNEGGTKSQKETTENNEQRENMNEQGEQKGNDVNTDNIKNEEGDQHEEEEEGEEVEEEEEAAAPFDKNHKRQVVLCRGVGSLGDLLFQYATVSSIARSSKRRAIFSSAFTPLLTLFPEAPIIIIEDEEIVQLEPLTNITLSDTQISFDSVEDDIPDEGSVEIVGPTRSWKYFHVILNSLKQELSPSKLYVEAADDYLEEVMRRALKDSFKVNANGKIENDKQDKTNNNGVEHNNKGFLKYNRQKHKNYKKFKSENGNVKPTEDEPKSIIEQMKSPEDAITLVGIHVPVMFTADEQEIKNGEREGENARKEAKMKEKEQTVLSYFRDAMDYYRDEHSIRGDYVQFVIVCEYLRWCIDNLNGPGVHFAVGGSSELDLSILARCDHAILTPSSLSWWSSWLTGGQVVYPATLSEMNRVALEDYVFPDWTEI